MGAASVALLLATSASCGTFTFDNNNPGAVYYNPLPATYEGLTWTGWATIDGASYAAIFGPSGYSNGVVSGASVACGCAPDADLTTDIIASSTAFTLNSGYFTSAWNDGETLLVQGFNGATLVDSVSFTINTEGPVLETFDWTGITSLDFTPSGGTSAGLNGSGEYFALDNLSVSGISVPEPAAWALMLAGFAGLGAALRLRRALPAAA
jgi:hypothetical protein